MEGLPMSAKIKSYIDDLKYLITNKTFMLVTLGFTALCFTTGALAWWGPHLIIDAVNWRNVTGNGLPSDPTPDK